MNARASQSSYPQQHRWKRPFATLIFDAPLARSLETARLPPTYVGVRRVRPSSHVVRQHLLQQNHSHSSKQKEHEHSHTSVVFKVVDPETGQERRMNAQEKKALKCKLRQEEKERKVKAKLDRSDHGLNQFQPHQEESSMREGARKRKEEAENGRVNEEDAEEAEKNESLLQDSSLASSTRTSSNRYVSLKVDPVALEQEMADLRGDRNGVPPVLVSAALTQAALKSRVFPHADPDFVVPLVTTVDDAYASRWAVALKEHMGAAEGVRHQEDMRSMAYQVVPEVWTRMRPIGMGTQNTDTMPPPQESSHANDTIKKTDLAWSFCELNPASTPSVNNDDSEALAAVVAVLHDGTTTHVSCGAKFGCDYLLYDGPRDQRHAFAGLRVLPHGCSPNGDAFPLPSAYDLAGFVRCLNTAGKLALLATAIRRDDCVQIAFLDLALEKLGSTAARPVRRMPSSLQKN